MVNSWSLIFFAKISRPAGDYLCSRDYLYLSGAGQCKQEFVQLQKLAFEIFAFTHLSNMVCVPCKYRVFFLHWASPKKLKYGKPRLGESTLT